MGRLIVCETDYGHFAVRPDDWAGIWTSDGKIKEGGLRHTAVFLEKQDAEFFVKCKELEEQEKLVVLPCKIGRNLYDIIEFAEGEDSPDIYTIDASRIEISKDKAGFSYCIDSCDYREEDFGKTLFTSEEEAIKAIREMGWIV